MIRLTAELRRFALKVPFRIASAVFGSTRALIVTADDGRHRGRGEAEGVFYLGETAQGILDQARAFIASHPDGVSREALQSALPPGGARNAIDCALWDLEAKQTGQSIWAMTGIEPRRLTTAVTIGLEAEPEAMAEKARAAGPVPVLKVKLNADRPVDRIEAIRAVRPDAILVVDVNEGWTIEQLKDVAPAMARLGVEMLEQPLPRGRDAELDGYVSPVPLCADESCLHSGELEAVRGRYHRINIKLDKTGGLTEALRLARKAREAGLGLMVGNMMGTSLAMAPSFVVGCLCDFVDIDGPVLLAQDWPNGLTYKAGRVDPPRPALWG